MSWLDEQLSPRIKERVVELSGDVTTHSALGKTLRALIEDAEEKGQPYTLRARPGEGYVLERDLIEVGLLDILSNVGKCSECGSEAWVVDTDGEDKVWLLCLDPFKKGCCNTIGVPKHVRIAEPT